MMSTSLSRFVLVDLDVEHVDAGELLEQDALAFHHRLGGQRADVAQAEHRGAVGDDGRPGCRARVAEGVGRVVDDLFAGRGDAGRVGQRQVALVDQLLGRRDRRSCPGSGTRGIRARRWRSSARLSSGVGICEVESDIGPCLLGRFL